VLWIRITLMGIRIRHNTLIRIRISIFTRCKLPNSETLEKVLKYVLACHLQIDSDPVPDLVDHFDADPDPYFLFD
jgi:hypothetical protein